MEKQENLHKELDFIQSLISRMANNSFLIKGWSMTLMSALVILGQNVIFSKPIFLVVMAVILVPFWWLDAFYRKQERIFRKIWDRAINDPKAENRIRYDLNPKVLANDVESIGKIMYGKAIFWFYFPMLTLLTIGYIAMRLGYITATSSN